MVHEKVDALYQQNLAVFTCIEEKFNRLQSIPATITRDNIKQRLLAELNGEREKTLIADKWCFLKSFGIYSTFILFLIVGAIVGRNKKKTHISIMFDCWSNNCMEFYGDIIPRLKSTSIGYFYNNNKNYSYCCSLKGIDPLRGKRKYFFTSSASYSVLIKHFSQFFFYWNLSKKTDLNLVELVVKLLFEIGKHLTMIEGTKIDLLVSAHDNGFSPYRHFIYTSNGVDRLLLIQNGGRVNLNASYNNYIYADYYAAWTARRLTNFTNMNCIGKFSSGSVRLDKRISETNSDSANLYDILFIEQVYNCTESIGAPNHDAYIVGLNNLVSLQLHHANLRIAYCCRPNRAVFENPLLINDIDEVLLDSNIIVLKPNPGETYDHVKKTHLVVAFDSSVRCEALMMNKPVVTCNYTGYPNDFVVVNSCEDAVIYNAEYVEFERKLLSMHQNSVNNDVNENCKNIWSMGKSEKSASEIIAELINTELKLQ
jgi:hypothetical protein